MYFLINKIGDNSMGNIFKSGCLKFDPKEKL